MSSLEWREAKKRPLQQANGLLWMTSRANYSRNESKIEGKKERERERAKNVASHHE